MYLKKPLDRFFNLKIQALSSLVFAFLFVVLQINNLEAGGWGKTRETVLFEGTKWNCVYYDMNKLSFTALMPHYSGAVLNNDVASLSGKVKGEGNYVITTSVNQKFSPPKTEKMFVKAIKKANPGFTVKAVDGSVLGVRFAVDMCQKKQENATFWRILSTRDHLIKMGTNDLNVNRRNNFFNSIKIK